MIRQQAFTGNKKLLKGNTHCHTTRSDALVSPEDVTQIYYEKGFDFFAMTDHRIYNLKSHRPDLPIITIPGMEYDSSYVWDDYGFRCFHTVTLGPVNDNPNGQDQQFPQENTPTQEAYQKLLDGFETGGQLTIHCHPHWSSTPPEHFQNLKNICAIELYNHVSVLDSREDTDNGIYWDQILGTGRVIYGVAGDDGHKAHQYGNSWIMVNAEPEIGSILNAIKAGKFYASTGPVIKDFYIDDQGFAHVECSDAAVVSFHCDKHNGKAIYPEEGKDTLNHAVFTFMNSPGKCAYVRAVVVDKQGKLAWTNPIFLDEGMFGNACQK